MCIGIGLALAFLLWFFSDALLLEYGLTEQIGATSIVVADHWGIVWALWPLALLFMVLGGVMVLLFLKVRRRLVEGR
jgi:heme/copper-type cytochrome/quinol oxidase subunit 2